MKEKKARKGILMAGAATIQAAVLAFAALGGRQEEESGQTVRTVAGHIKYIRNGKIIVDVVEFFPDEGNLIYNADGETVEWKVSDDAVFEFVNWEYDYTWLNGGANCVTKEIDLFDKYKGGHGKNDAELLFEFEVAGDTVIRITEQFL